MNYLDKYGDFVNENIFKKWFSTSDEEKRKMGYVENDEGELVHPDDIKKSEQVKKDKIDELKIKAPIDMISEGLAHTRKVYKGVYEFTNLVKKDAVLNLSKCNIKKSLSETTALLNSEKKSCVSVFSFFD